MCFLCFALFWTNFLQNFEAWVCVICGDSCKMKSVQHFWSCLQYNMWKAWFQQHRWGMSEEFSEKSVVFCFDRQYFKFIKCKELFKTTTGLVNGTQLICTYCSLNWHKNESNWLCGWEIIATKRWEMVIWMLHCCTAGFVQHCTGA